MSNSGSRAVSGFNHILEETFQYYAKSNITLYAKFLCIT